MTAAWTVVLVVVGGAVGLVAAGFVQGVVRNIVQTAREQTARDLIACDETRAATEALALRTGQAAVALAAPGVTGRSWIGWLWWRSDLGPDRTVRTERGWAATHRRARRAAGLPTGRSRLSAPDPEIMVTMRRPEL